MAWKTEKWMTDIFPGEENIYSNYRNLNAREFSLVSCAVIDSAIAELISMRLKESSNKELETFLGVNGDGRAPCGSLGAKLQLAYLLRILTKNDLLILRGFKKIRNSFAHSVNVDFTKPEIVKVVKRIHQLWIERSKEVSEKTDFPVNIERLKSFEEYFEIEPEACHGFLLGIFTTYQAYFHRLHDKVVKINNAI